MDTKQHTRHVPQALCPQQTMTATMPCAGCVRRLRRITTRATSVEGKASVWACPRAARSSRCGVSVTRFVAAPVSSVCGCCARAPSGGNRRTPGSTSPLPISVCIWRAFWLAATMASAAWIQAQLNTRGCVHSEPHPSLTFGADPRSPFAPTHDGVDEVDQMSVGDAGFFLTSGLNKWCHQHPHIFDLVIIAHALVYDALAIHLSLFCILYARTSRPIVAYATLLLLRSAAQALVHMPCPHGFYWKDPGFPTLTIDYHPAADFFFSGHTSTLVVAAIEYWEEGFWRASALLWALVPPIITFVITTRTHYTADVITAVLAGHVATRVGDMWEFLVSAPASSSGTDPKRE